MQAIFLRLAVHNVHIFMNTKKNTHTHLRYIKYCSLWLFKVHCNEQQRTQFAALCQIIITTDKIILIKCVLCFISSGGSQHIFFKCVNLTIVVICASQVNIKVFTKLYGTVPYRYIRKCAKYFHLLIRKEELHRKDPIRSQKYYQLKKDFINVFFFKLLSVLYLNTYCTKKKNSILQMYSIHIFLEYFVFKILF